MYFDDVSKAEACKYMRMWAQPAYSAMSPGERSAKFAFELLAMTPDSSLCDVGCGRGLAADIFHGLGMKVTQYDIVNVARNNLPFIHGSLWQTAIPECDYIFCCDVLEHIPTDKVEAAVKNLLNATLKSAYIQVSCTEDGCGKLIGESLHLTIKDGQWWVDRFMEYGCGNFTTHLIECSSNRVKILVKRN
jgi:hypothetical protein